jgi:outer membrane receptor for ferrienterochelin and colicins
MLSEARLFRDIRRFVERSRDSAWFQEPGHCSRVRRLHFARTSLWALVAAGACASARMAAAEPKAAAAPCKDDAAGKPRAGCAPLEVVVTGTRTKESSQRATVRTETVTREEAERRGARNVAEALAGEPTLQVNPQAYDYLGSPSGVQMQGLDGDRVLVLEDGERVIGDTGGVIDLATLPLTDVDRIEYVVGPTSSLYGTNALGGVINIVTAPPRYEGPSARGRVEGRTSGDWLTEASAAYRKRRTWAAVDGSYFKRHEHELDGGPALLVPSGSTALVGLRGGFRPERRIDVRLKAKFAEDRSQGLTTQDVPGLGTYLIDTPEKTRRLTLNALETLDLGHGSHVDFSLAHARFSGDNARDRRDSPVDESRHRDADLESFEATATLADGEKRTWVVGARGESEGFSESVDRVTVAGGALVPRSAAEVLPQRLSSGAAYAQLGYRVTDQLSVLPGVRGEIHTRYGGVVAPRLALAYRPSELVTLRASGGRGFRAPSAKEYGFVFDHSVLGYRVLGNPELLPESSWGINGDVTVRPSAAWRVRVGGFYNWVSNLIDFTVAPVQPDPTVVDYVYVNVDRARTAGTDASLRVEPVSGLVGTLAYAYLYTHDDENGGPLPNRPPHTLTASLGARLPAHFDALLRYRLTTRTPVTDELDTPTYSLLDARIGYRPARTLEFYLGASNLLDAQRDPHSPGDARPTLGRTFYFGIRGELADDDETP